MASHTGLLHWTATQALRDSSHRPLAQPLPRCSPQPPPHPAPSTQPRPHSPPPKPLPTQTEILTIGAGPAGLLTHLLLTRYGLCRPSNALCVDAAPHATRAGHADGLFPRTLEILRSLGLEGVVEREGVWVGEMAGWSRKGGQGGEGEGDGKDGKEGRKAKAGITRDGVNTTDSGNGRYREGLFRSLHQGRVERVLEEDLACYGADGEMGVRRGWRCVGVRVEDGAGGDGYPVVGTLRRTGVSGEGQESGGVGGGEREGEVMEVRAKYLVGADGAHSSVRKALGIQMVGDTSDDIYGVIDFVPESDFPDIRRQSTIVTEEGSILHIPREARANGERAVRLYVPFGSVDKGALVDLPEPEEVVINGGMKTRSGVGASVKKDREVASTGRDACTQVTVEKIFERANALFAPFTVKPKDVPGCIEWWAAYRVGQRVATHQSYPPSTTDTALRPRVFLVGDAAHTHSPKIGQGLNVSMQDSYNLAWKLAHVVMGLVPSENEVAMLRSYEAERRPIAEQLVNIDKLWYSERYKRIDMKEVPSEMLLGEVLQFCSGIGLEYAGGTPLVGDKQDVAGVQELQRLKKGHMRVGRRMPDVQLKRFADGVEMTLHDECPSTGTWRILAFTAQDLTKTDSISAQTLAQLCTLVGSYPQHSLELTVLHCVGHLSFEWTDLPPVVRQTSEMHLYRVKDDGYKTLGVDDEEGGIVLMRPDGTVALILGLGNVAVNEVQQFISRLLLQR